MIGVIAGAVLFYAVASTARAGIPDKPPGVAILAVVAVMYFSTGSVGGSAYLATFVMGLMIRSADPLSMVLALYKQHEFQKIPHMWDYFRRSRALPSRQSESGGREGGLYVTAEANKAPVKRFVEESRTNGTAGLATFEPARPLAWQTAAIGEYERSWPIRHTDLREQLGARIMALTGRRISSGEIFTDGHLAVVGVDGATFRLYQYGGLVLVRGCAYCGTGHFESPQISDHSDLGYALSAWQPLHEDCEYSPSEDLADF